MLPSREPRCASKTCARRTGPGGSTARAGSWNELRRRADFESTRLEFENHGEVDGNLAPARRRLDLRQSVERLSHHVERLVIQYLISARALHERALDHSVRAD